VGNLSTAFDSFPPDGPKILLVLFLSFLVGLEREERVAGDVHRSFGGVRTFPLIGLIGYALALLSGADMWPLGLGFLAISGFLSLSYWHKLVGSDAAGITSEMSALATFLIGALVQHEHYWISTTLAVASMILLELKVALEGLAKRTAPEDVFTFTKFLLLTAVILPIVPNHEYTAFNINPFKTWLVVVAVCGISYGSYVIQKVAKGKGGIVLAAILGGAYSSTVTTIVMAKKAVQDPRSNTLSGAILIASGMMYLRLGVLVGLFNRDLMERLTPSFIVLGIAAVIVGWLWSRRDAADSAPLAEDHTPSNPLEIKAALLFAVFFVAMLVVGHFASIYLGKSGVFTLAAVMGVTDVDPFIMSMTQAPPASAAAALAAPAILLAAASNNIAKGVYSFTLAPRVTGIKSLVMLLALAAAGLTPLLW
jgi:uncharacterized membrane protein (DUF4010 family)